MNSSKADERGRPGWGVEELQLLAALGFGPDSVLMNEPKLFVDAAFLAALQRELADELGDAEAERAFFHIGLLHGLRDAIRIGTAEPAGDGCPELVEYPSLVMRLGPLAGHARRPGCFEATGCWPDAFEAESRLSKLGASPAPACALSAGYTSGWLSGTLDRDIVAVETSCRAAGAPHCAFVVRDEEPSGSASGPHASPRLSIATLRAVAGQTPCGRNDGGAPALAPALPSALDPEDPAVHIWGPVMVMPFIGPEAALQTIELLEQDDATRAVRVVVLDLCGALLDEGFGAAAVERLVEDVQSWGAEVILTGISPLCEEVVAELQASLLLSRKDLPEAIAYAFQIAEAQRHLL